MEEYTCKCVGKHIPLPLELNPLIVEEETIYLCPTSFQNLQHLLGEYTSHGGRPPGSVRKHYSDYIQAIAARIVDRAGSIRV